MNRVNLLASVVAVPVLISGAAIVRSAFAQNPNATAKHVQWDYRIDQDSRGLQASLDALGNEGWELVCSIPQAGSDSVKIVFKRQK